MTVEEIMAELESLGSEQTVKTFRRHGADGPMFGVKVGDLKKVVRKIKGDQELALALYDTGNSDAMYLAGLVADGSQMTKRQLDNWAKDAWWHMISDWTVPWVASDHPDATGIAKKWMKSKKENVASAGWNTYVTVVSTRDDSELDFDEIRELLKQVEKGIDKATNRIRYNMNGFVIAVGSFVKPLLKDAKAVAKKIGKVEVDMGDTSCKVPLATEYIAKVESMGRVGKKRKEARC